MAVKGGSLKTFFFFLLVGMESKFVDRLISGQSVNNANGMVVVLGFPTLGTGQSQRVGDRIRVNRIQGCLTFRAPIARNFSLIRVLVYIDWTIDGTTPFISGAGGVLLPGTWPPSGTLPIHSPLNLDEEDRFLVLYDELHVAQQWPVGFTVSSQTRVTVKWNLWVDFQQYMCAPADYGPQVCVGLVPQCSVSPCVMDGKIRYRFTDS